MKKLGLAFIVILCGLLIPVRIQAEDLLTMTKDAGYKVSKTDLPKAYILVDLETGQILEENNSELSRDPANLTKLMTVYLVLEAVENGQLKLDKKINLNTSLSYSPNYYTVEDLVALSLISSSNDAAIALASTLQTLTGTDFIESMNQKAKDLGMSHTKFVNETGAASLNGEAAQSVTTARDLALLSYDTLTNYPEVLTYTEQTTYTIQKGTASEETLTSYNHSLEGDAEGLGMSGVNGLITGSSANAGFNAIVTAKRNNRQLISVVLGVGDWNNQEGVYTRHYFANTLLEHGFSDFSYQLLAKKGEYELAGQTYDLNNNLYGLIKKGESKPKLEVTDGNLHLKSSSSSSLLTPPKGVKAPLVKKGLFSSQASTKDYPFVDIMFYIGLLATIAVLIGMTFFEQLRQLIKR